MEQAIIDLMNVVVAKFPFVAGVYMILSAAYMLFCAIATMTKTDKDDKIAEKIKVFFSLPIKKK